MQVGPHQLLRAPFLIIGNNLLCEPLHSVFNGVFHLSVLLRAFLQRAGLGVEIAALDERFGHAARYTLARTRTQAGRRHAPIVINELTGLALSQRG